MTGRSARGCLLEIVETLVLTLIVFVVIQTFLVQPFRVHQMSMQQTLEPGEHVLVDRLTPRFDPYRRGDIVVFDPPADWARDDPATPFIKRIVAVGGERIEIRDGRVLVDGTELVEPYVFAIDGLPEDTTDPLGIGVWVVPEGEVFVMGDHRSDSVDSRTFGPIAVDLVIGRAWLRYWPLETFGLLPGE